MKRAAVADQPGTSAAAQGENEVAEGGRPAHHLRVLVAAAVILVVAGGAGAGLSATATSLGRGVGSGTLLASGHASHSRGAVDVGHGSSVGPSGGESSTQISPAATGRVHWAIGEGHAQSTATSAPAPSVDTALVKGPVLSYGDSGPAVTALQERLTALGYWVGTPFGYFGDSTQQAVWALQKAAGLTRDGVVGKQTRAALARGVVPAPLPAKGYVIEVDLADDLVMFVDNGRLEYILNCSTGGGYYYSVGDMTGIAITPTGVFHTYAEIDGPDVDALGELWMPKFFTGGYAIHGDGYVPPFPASHGCVRVSNEAIDWIWASNLDPIGTEVWVY